jgi:hypothetical protein
MSNTPVSTNLLESLQIFTKFIVECVGKELSVLSVYNILLSVEEPFWNFVLCRILNDGDDSFQFFGSKLSSSRTSEISWEI